MRILTRKQFQDDLAKMWSEAVHAEYKAQIEAAVLAEREACAKMVDHILKEGGGTWGDAIRARGEQA
jgi:stalled ribosome rescue protein Dom34